MKDWTMGTRTTGIYVLALASILVLSSCLLYRGMKNQRIKEAKSGLCFEASVVSRLIKQGMEDASLPQGSRINMLLGPIRSRRWITIYDLKGHILWTSLKRPPSPGRLKVVRSALGGKKVFSWQEEPQGVKFFCLTIPLRSKVGILGALAIAVNERELDPLHGEFWVTLVWLVLLLSLFSIATGRLLLIRFRYDIKRLSRAIDYVSASGGLPHGIRKACRMLKKSDTANRDLSELEQAMRRNLRSLLGGLSDCMDQLEKLSLLFRNMKEAVILIDAEKKIATMNRAAEKIASIRERTATGRPVTSLFRDLGFRKFIDRIYRNRRDTECEITLYAGREGMEKRTFAIKAAVLMDEASGQLTGILVVMDDRTKLKRLEDTRRQFVANVSHELKTPVTAIKGYIETLMDGVDSKETQKKFLDIVQRQATRLENLVEDVLFLSRMDADTEKPGLNIYMDRIGLIIDEAIETCRLQAASRNIEVEVLCPEPDVEIPVDPPLMGQALTNLLINAINYSHPGKKVIIRCRTRNGTVEISVQDQGPGISKKDMEHIFERFYRADKARSRHLGGTGLGLAIVKHVVKAHKGEIKVESAPGHGAIFTIILPTKLIKVPIQNAR